MRLAIDIGATKTAMAWFDEKLQLHFPTSFLTERYNWDIFQGGILTNVKLARKKGFQADDIGISVAGVVDPVTLRVQSANIPALTDRNLGCEISDALGCPTYVRNDGECLALAEAIAGAGSDYRTVFAIILGSGVGGALVVNSRLLRGATGQGGEWGHGNALDSIVSHYGLTDRVCGCGRRNCLDLFGAGLGLSNIHNDLSGETTVAKDIVTRWSEGDDLCERTITVFLEIVSSQLAFTVNVVNPEIIPVGGGLANSDVLVTRLDELTREKMLGRANRSIVVPAHRVNDGCIVGAALLSKDNC